MKLDTFFKFRFDHQKNAKLPYFVRSFAMLWVPKRWFRLHLERSLEKSRLSDDREYIADRVNYYNKLKYPVTLPDNAASLGSYTYRRRSTASTYFFDTYRFTRWFPDDFRWLMKGGDVTELFSSPTIVKSRPVVSGNENSVLLKLNQVRHFIFVRDRLLTSEKDPRPCLATSRMSSKRRVFFERWQGNPRVKLFTLSHLQDHPDWYTGKVSIDCQLKYKYLLSIEGYDVSSNLKWVMSSNSVAMMPKPEYETWFMEGRLIPNYHYIEINADASDLLDKVDYYERHAEEVAAIVEHAHQWVRQFMDKRRELLISLSVMNKYFVMTGQK